MVEFLTNMSVPVGLSATVFNCNVVPLILLKDELPSPVINALTVPSFCWNLIKLSESEPDPTLKSTDPFVASVNISGLGMELSYTDWRVSGDVPPPPVPANFPCGITKALSKSPSPFL